MMSKMPSTRKAQPMITAVMKIVMWGHTKPTMPAPTQNNPKTRCSHRCRAILTEPMISKTPTAMKNPLAR